MGHCPIWTLRTPMYSMKRIHACKFCNAYWNAPTFSSLVHTICRRSITERFVPQTVEFDEAEMSVITYQTFSSIMAHISSYFPYFLIYVDKNLFRMFHRNRT